MMWRHVGLSLLLSFADTPRRSCGGLCLCRICWLLIGSCQYRTEWFQGYDGRSGMTCTPAVACGKLMASMSTGYPWLSSLPARLWEDSTASIPRLRQVLYVMFSPLHC